MLSKVEQKFIKSLKLKKYRTREKRFLVEGTKNVLEVCSSDFVIDLIIGTSHFYAQYHHLLNKVRFEIVKPDLLVQMGNFKKNVSSIAIVQIKDDSEFVYARRNHLFFLDGIADPGNVGTIIRVLDWFGFDQLVCSPDCAEFYHPKVISSTMGSFTRVNTYRMELSQLLCGVSAPILGTDMKGKNLFKYSIDEPSIIVMGSESHGIRDQVKGHISTYIAIPRVGGAESLNVGVATGIIASYLHMPK